MPDTFNVRSAMGGGPDILGTAVFEDGVYAGGTWDGVETRFGPFLIKKGVTMDDVQDVCRTYVFEKVGEVEKDAEIELSADGEIAKMDKKQQIVFGWAYVTHDTEGNVNVDKSGDFIDAVEEIEKSAYDYVLSSRKGDADHTNVQSGRLVESIVFTPDKIEKMGIPPGTVPLGWWLGYKVDDPEVWKRVEKGELRAFSIHGKGTRKSVD